MKRILKTVSAVSIVASLAVSANAAPLVGAAIAGAMFGGLATQNAMMNNQNAYVYYEQPQVVYQDTVVHANGTVSSYMTTPPATVIAPQQTVITTTTTQKPVAYTETMTVMPGLTMREKTTYVQQQPTVTVVQPQPTTIIYQQPVVNTNPVVVYY